METSLRFQRLGQFHCQTARYNPANILIGPDKRVITQDIRGKELIDKVKQLIEQDKEKEKAAKEAERTRKRQNKK